MIEHVLPVAVQTAQGMLLAQGLVGELRPRRVLVHPVAG
jgi:hypothetical protein